VILKLVSSIWLVLLESNDNAAGSQHFRARSEFSAFADAISITHWYWCRPPKPMVVRHGSRRAAS